MNCRAIYFDSSFAANRIQDTFELCSAYISRLLSWPYPPLGTETASREEDDEDRRPLPPRRPGGFRGLSQRAGILIFFLKKLNATLISSHTQGEKLIRARLLMFLLIEKGIEKGGKLSTN